MDPFERIVVQPLFNLLLGIYALVGDFGVSIIILSILVRIALWPLLRRQLHQSKLMRAVAPELKKIKARSKGDRALETRLMLELYKERGVKPLGSLWIVAIQIPILIALFTVLRTITEHRDQIASFAYGFYQNVAPIKDILANPSHFNERLFGILDLTQTAHQSWVIAALAVATAIFQYIQSRQILPQVDSKRRLRDVLREQAAGGAVDQSEMSALLNRRLVSIMPVIVLIFMVSLPGALVLYYAVQSLVAIGQQYYYLKKDSDEMVKIADAPASESSKVTGNNNGGSRKATAKARARAAQNAQIVKDKK